MSFPDTLLQAVMIQRLFSRTVMGSGAEPGYHRNWLPRVVVLHTWVTNLMECVLPHSPAPPSFCSCSPRDWGQLKNGTRALGFSGRGPEGQLPWWICCQPKTPQINWGYKEFAAQDGRGLPVLVWQFLLLLIVIVCGCCFLLNRTVTMVCLR